MTHEPERLRAVPTRESVGRESRVHHGEVRSEIWIGQISKVLQHLLGVQHPFVDHHLGGKAANVKEQSLLQALIKAQLMTRAFADHIQLPFEIVTLQSIGRANEQLHDVRLRRAGGRTDLRLLRADGYVTPAQALLTLLSDDRLHGLHALFALGLDSGQEHQAGTEPAFRRQLQTQIFLSHFTQKALRQSDHNTGAIPGIRLATATAAVLHIHQHLQRIEHILMARFAL